MYDNVVHYLAGATVTQTPTSKPPSEMPVSPSGGMKNVALIAGIVCAVVVFLVVIGIFCFCCLWKGRTSKAKVHTCTDIVLNILP